MKKKMTDKDNLFDQTGYPREFIQIKKMKARAD